MEDLNSTTKKNHVIVVDESVDEVKTLVERCGDSIGELKIASAAVPYLHQTQISEIVRMCIQNGIVPYVGGGITETYVAHNMLYQLTRKLHGLGIDAIEVSTSNLNISEEKFREVARSVRRDFKTVLIEIGEKESAGDRLDYGAPLWIRDIRRAQDVGADKIIFEGGGYGEVGIFDENGYPRLFLIGRLLWEVKDQLDKVIIEAPERRQHSFLIRKVLGPRIGMGNLYANEGAMIDIAEDRRVAASRQNVGSVNQTRQELMEIAFDIDQTCTRLGVDPSCFLEKPVRTSVDFGPATLKALRDQYQGQLPQWRF